MSCARKALKLEALRTLQKNSQFQCHSLTKPRLFFQDSDKRYYKIIRCYDHTAMTTNGDSFTVLHCLLLLLAKTQLQNIMVVSRIIYSEHAWQTRAQKVWNRREYTTSWEWLSGPRHSTNDLMTHLVKNGWSIGNRAEFASGSAISNNRSVQ